MDCYQSLAWQQRLIYSKKWIYFFTSHCMWKFYKKGILLFASNIEGNNVHLLFHVLQIILSYFYIYFGNNFWKFNLMNKNDIFEEKQNKMKAIPKLNETSPNIWGLAKSENE